MQTTRKNRFPVALTNLDNLAIVILLLTVILVSIVIFFGEALPGQPTEGLMRIFGWSVESSWKRKDFTAFLAVAAAVVALLCIAQVLFKGIDGRFRKWIFALLVSLVVMCICSATLMYGFIRPLYFDAGDAFCYWLGPKYFDELGYDVHYECAAAAQMETGSRLTPRGRDLRTNEMKPIRELASPAARTACRSRFSSSRWDSYKQDVDTFRAWHGNDGWKRRFRDHGYNGTPVYQAIAGRIANALELNHRNMVLLSLLNLWMVLIMAGAVIKAFGWRFGLLFAIFFWVNFTEQWLLGGAFLRYEWICALVCGICFLKTGRYAISGGLLALAAGVKIFPILLFAGISLMVVHDLVRRGGVKPEHLQFIKGALLTGAVLGVISVAHGHGLNNWSEFLHQMKLNSGRYSTMRLGFVYNFLWPKELLPADAGAWSYALRVAAMKEPFFLFVSLNHIRWLLTLGVFAFAARHLKRMDDIVRTVFVAFILFFMLFGTVRYYYSGLLGLPFMWHRDNETTGGRLFMATLFALSAAGYLLQEFTAFEFTYNTFYPMAFTFLILAILIHMEVRHRRQPAAI